MFRRLAFSSLLALLAAPVMAQPSADRLPADTMVYVGWSPMPGVSDTAAAHMLADQRLVAPWRELLQTFALALPDDINGPRISDHLPALLSEAVRSPGCIAILNEKIDAGELSPEAAIIIDLGERRKSFEENIKPLQSRVKERLGERLHMAKVQDAWLWLETDRKERPTAAWGFIGDTFVYYRGRNAEKVVPTLLAPREKSLKTEPAFADCMAKLPGNAVVTTYLNGPRVLNLARDATAQLHNPDAAGAAVGWPKVVDEIGFDNLKSIGETTTIDNGQFVTHTLAFAPGGAHGLLADLLPGAVDDALLKCAPPDATILVAGRLDAAKAYERIKAAAANIGGDEAKRQFDEIEQAAAGAQLPVKDSLAPLGDQWLLFEAPSSGGFVFTGLTLVGTVKDEKKIGQTLDTVAALLAKTFGNGLGGPSRAVVRSYEADDVKIEYIDFAGGFNIFRPCWTVVDHKLYIALFPQVLEDAVAQAKANTSILDDADFASARKRVGEGSLLFVSEARLAKVVYPVLPLWMSAISGFEEMTSRETGRARVNPTDLLPSRQHLLKYLGDSAAAVRATPDGILKTRSQPNPLLSWLTLDSPALWLALSAPMLEDPEERAIAEQRTASASNLRQIGQACFMYASDHKGEYPPDLATLQKEQSLGEEVMLSPLATPGAEGAYNFVHFAGMTNRIMPDVVVAYDAPDLKQGEGANVLFADGRVMWLDKAAVDQALAHSKEIQAQKAPEPAGPAAEVVPDNTPAPAPPQPEKPGMPPAPPAGQ